MLLLASNVVLPQKKSKKRVSGGTFWIEFLVVLAGVCALVTLVLLAILVSCTVRATFVLLCSLYLLY